MNINPKNELSLSCDTRVLKHAIGYWSKAKIEYNLTQNLVVLRQECTSHLLLEEIKDLHEKLLTTPSFKNYYTSWIGKNYLGALKLAPALSGDHNNWSILQEKLREQKYNKSRISRYCAEKWWEYYKKQPSHGVDKNKLARIPSHLAPFVLDWPEIITDNTEDFILNFCKLSQISLRPTPQTHPNYSSLPVSQKVTIFLSQLSVEERSLIEKALPNLSHIMDERKYYEGAHIAINAAIVLIAWLRKKKLLILPPNLEKVDSYFLDLEVWPKRILNIQEARLTLKKGLLKLIASSTTENIDDIPEDIAKIYGVDFFRPGFYQSLSRLLNHPKIQKKRPVFPIDMLQPGKIKRTQSLTSWTPAWIKKNYNDAWYDFATLWWMHAASDQHKSNALRGFLTWAYDNRHIESPWEIKPVDLRNPHRPSYSGTYFHFLKKTKIQDKSACWSTSTTLFRVVCEYAQMVDSPTMVHGELKNPFKSVKNPFLRQRKKKDKTHRSYIPSSIHEMMIHILLSPDSNGKPTFSWAKRVLSESHLDIVRVPDPEQPNKELETWCPSRATCLALLLLTPLRTAQARWLDQGLMDEERYDFESKSMVPNEHELKTFRYPNGKSHMNQYGRPSGVLQFSSDLLTRQPALSIFVNTNKNQLWSGLRQSGYEIPWPDGIDLLNSENPEQRSKGEWLARLYWLIEFQMKWMSKYDPNPHPISFFESPEDSSRTTDLDEVRDSLPWFVPLFRDISDRKFVSYKLNDIHVGGHCPVSYSKISYLYRLLTIETEKQWKETFNETIYLTYFGENGNGPLCKFDLHSLRVTWVSRLFEMGVPVEIISEYIVGHATKLMTTVYLKFRSAHARETLILAAQNNDNLGFEALLKREINTDNIPNFLVGNGTNDLSEYLPEDFIAFVPVAGGICPMGGKGSACLQGAITPPSDKSPSGKQHKGDPVQGGCGNCRYFLTGPDFILEQLLMCNTLMYQMRSLGKEQRRLYNELDEFKWKLHELPEDSLVQKHRLERQKQVYSERINDYNELLSPLLLEWCNRFEMARLSDDLLQEQANNSPNQLLLLGNSDLSAEDYYLEVDDTSEFGLVRTIIEQARIVTRQGYTMPEEPSRFLREFMATLLDDSLWQSFLHRIPDDFYITQAASILAGVLKDEFGDDEIQKFIDKRLLLPTTTFQNEKIQSFMEELCENYIEGNKSIPALPDTTTAQENIK